MPDPSAVACQSRTTPHCPDVELYDLLAQANSRTGPTERHRSPRNLPDLFAIVNTAAGPPQGTLPLSAMQKIRDQGRSIEDLVAFDPA